MENELQAKVEEKERRATGKIEGNALDAEVQWCNRMDKLYAREAAVLQASLWAPGAQMVENIGVQRRKI